MPHHFGLHAKTRKVFSKPFRKNGVDPLSRYLINYKIGDYVTIIIDGSKHNGMPHRIYQGKTGKVFNITPHAVGVIINKRLRNKIIQKKLNVRLEHVKKSGCRTDFLERIKINDELKKNAKLQQNVISTKRSTKGPKDSHFVIIKKDKFVTLNPKPFIDVF